MAAGSLPKPGTEFGPCMEPCVHEDCALTRKMAESECYECKKPIGYDRRFFDHRERGLCHESCAHEALSRLNARLGKSFLS